MRNSKRPRHAVHVDTPSKAANLIRVKRIEGQVRGIARMIDEDRYCADILDQVAAVQQALRGVAKQLLRNHLRHCVAKTAKTDEASAERMYDEVVELFHKNAK